MVTHLMPFKILAFGLSDIGLVRQNNEDVWAQLPEVGFYTVADGMGGHQAGEIASRETVSALCRIMSRKLSADREELSLEEAQDLLRRAIRHVNGHVFKMSRTQPGLRGMGTTLCCLLFRKNGLVFAHVGDSRIYRLRNGKLEQLTKDHSLLRELVDQGQMNEKQAADFLYKNIITKAIGTEVKVEPTVVIGDIQTGDVYIMCTDGLSDQLSIKEMEHTLKEFTEVKEATEQLVALAKEKGGRDNITVVIAKVE